MTQQWLCHYIAPTALLQTFYSILRPTREGYIDHSRSALEVRIPSFFNVSHLGWPLTVLFFYPAYELSEYASCIYRTCVIQKQIWGVHINLVDAAWYKVFFESMYAFACGTGMLSVVLPWTCELELCSVLQTHFCTVACQFGMTSPYANAPPLGFIW